MLLEQLARIETAIAFQNVKDQSEKIARLEYELQRSLRLNVALAKALRDRNPHFQ